MAKTFHVAVREFLATVMTKAFILAVVLPPVLMVAALALMPVLINQASPRVNGRIAMIDETGVVAPRLADAFSHDRMDARRAAKRRDRMKAVESRVPLSGGAQAQAHADAMAGSADLRLEPLPPGQDLAALKAEIARSNAKESVQVEGDPLLALVIVPEDAVRPAPAADGAPAAPPAHRPFEFFVAPKLDIEVQEDIREEVAKAVVDARLEAQGIDPRLVRGLLGVPRVTPVVVTDSGERRSGGEAEAFLIPAAFLFLLWISVFTAGQYLLTSTIEEKSNRVMEVLLSAVSPMQLMVGKILGQMAVGAVILAAYAGVGMSGLIYASMQDAVDPLHLVYLAVYFLIAFFLIASLMAAVGSAVSDVKEAQSLLGPVMIVLVIPMILWFPIVRNPNSTFAQAVSFIPPVSPFVMVLRLAGSEAVPFWQIPATIGLGLLSAAFAAWIAAKIFRIGVLMYGKPPNLATLIRWVKMA